MGITYEIYNQKILGSSNLCKNNEVVNLLNFTDDAHTFLVILKATNVSVYNIK